MRKSKEVGSLPLSLKSDAALIRMLSGDDAESHRAGEELALRGYTEVHMRAAVRKSRGRLTSARSVVTLSKPGA